MKSPFPPLNRIFWLAIEMQVDGMSHPELLKNSSNNPLPYPKWITTYFLMVVGVFLLVGVWRPLR
jgi:hypothetical protein